VSEVHSAVGSYVVSALDGRELDEFEAHLATCETCSREIRGFSEAAAELPLLVASSPPPPLRSSILAAIKEVRPLPPETLPAEVPETSPAPGPEPPRRTGTPRRALIEEDQVLPEEPEEEEGEGELPPVDVRTEPPAVRPVDELALRRARRRNRILAVVVAAAMVVAVALGGWVYTLIKDRQAQVAEAARESQLYSAADVKIYPVRMVNGGRASFVVSKSLNTALFVSDNLPGVAADRQYELWTLRGQQAIRDSLVDGGGRRKQWFTGSISAATAVAVTIEPTGGSNQPTPPIQASAALE
jgi:anti-sigma-K factor RskA